MKTSELKLKIFKRIDSLSDSDLEEFYGFLSNFINGKRDLDDWNQLSSNQQEGILAALNQVKEGNVISHEEVIEKLRKKYKNA